MFETNPYLKHYFATRRRLKLGLVVAGAGGGALIGVALTILGKIVTQAPPATFSNFVVNAGWFALFGAIIGPVVTWSALRRAPLWRTMLEPVVAAVAGAAIGVAVGSATLFLALIPLGIVASVTRLTVVYREKQPAPRLIEERAV